MMPDPLSPLLDLDRRLVRVNSRDDLDRVLVDWAISAGADAAWCGHPEAGGKMRFRAWGGDGLSEYLHAVTIRADEGPAAEGPAGRAWRTGRIQTAADWNGAPEMEPWREAGEVAGWRSVTAVPLAGPEGPVAVLALYSRTPERFATPPWPQLLEHVALVAGMTLHRLNLALTDHLTGLPNRRALEVQLEGALSRSARHQRLLAIGLLDLDDFKPVNDRYGHAFGDEVLRRSAARLKEALRASDFVARLGGDEFFLIFEDLEDLDDLEPVLQRVHEGLTAPLEVDGVTVRVGASLGLVLYPLCEPDMPGELLRLADRALYQSKAGKGTRSTWWSLPDEGPRPDAGTTGQTPLRRAGAIAPPYGPAAGVALAPLAASLIASAAALARNLRGAFSGKPEAAALLDTLPESEYARLQAALAAHLRLLVEPELDEERHRQAAQAVGRVHCIVGVDPAWITETYGTWLARVRQASGESILRAQLALPVLDRRLARDAEFQRIGYERIAAERERMRARIDVLAWTAERYADLIEGAVRALVDLQEIAAAAIARPNEEAIFLPEAMAGEACLRYLEAVRTGAVPPIVTDPALPGGRGAGPESWRTGTIHRNTHFATDAEVSPWRDLALSAGVRSVAAVPLTGTGGRREAILLLFSPYPGGLGTPAQRTLLEHLQRSLSLGITRIEAEAGRPRVQALPERLHYRDRLRGGGLVMHYQPLIELHGGRLIKAEALARLRDGETLIPPARFLPVFLADDLFDLYRLGLLAALQATRGWARRDLRIGVSVNLPPAGLHDPRYLEATRRALADHPLPEGAGLTLEVLETHEFMRTDRPLAERLAPFRALGIEFAEDDLGTGYSSLARLRELPFDLVKIDKSLVLPGRDEPERLLNLIGQLTALAHALGAGVVAEGLEDVPLAEAVGVLGADYGQGRAIAPPLEAEALPAWAGMRRPAPAGDPPRSALALLACFLQWQARATSLAGASPVAAPVAEQLPALVDRYLGGGARHDDSLTRSARRIGDAVRAGGTRTGEYAHLRREFLDLLQERMRTEANEPA